MFSLTEGKMRRNKKDQKSSRRPNAPPPAPHSIFDRYWYKTWIYECPCCGAGDRYRERQYTPKPEDPRLRTVFHDRWCGNTC